MQALVKYLRHPYLHSRNSAWDPARYPTAMLVSFYCNLKYDKLQSQQFTAMTLYLQLPEKRLVQGVRMATGCCSRRRGAMLQCLLAPSEDVTS